MSTGTLSKKESVHLFSLSLSSISFFSIVLDKKNNKLTGKKKGSYFSPPRRRPVRRAAMRPTFCP